MEIHIELQKRPWRKGRFEVSVYGSSKNSPEQVAGAYKRVLDALEHPEVKPIGTPTKKTKKIKKEVV